MLTLNELLRLICDRTNVHVCIHDISGILKSECLQIDSRFKTHTKPFCDAAKLSDVGYDTCVGCKDAANRRAASGEEFSRFCPFGIYEIVRPVTISGKVKCIIYLGNLAFSHSELASRAIKCCKDIEVPPDKVTSHCEEVEVISDKCTEEYYERLCNYIRELIVSLYNEKDVQSSEERMELHWCVRNVCEYVTMNMSSPMTLSALARLYFINEKYLGRLFKNQMGKSFHEYLTQLRLERSLSLLASGQSVISVSEECGFRDVTYYNRCFKKAYGITPGKYRSRK